ncbi:hypothetical protein, unlikely [Trypanosoma brucei brucei TREU927]|uniref:Uncharacterized protein n=1 Tax=Trypanosoma brucei brucei (strain 927/4 GUTat10.1) TaxID=185431 RepID=Q38FK1_TRYB2|nr:hypothetical protein, unlikely [Trypanosoma brucei brucei TREU927]EAN76419.1 hypothetical protein, unlikely [Trypanosoma brucei brucei TREU927]
MRGAQQIRKHGASSSPTLYTAFFPTDQVAAAQLDESPRLQQV